MISFLGEYIHTHAPTRHTDGPADSHKYALYTGNMTDLWAGVVTALKENHKRLMHSKKALHQTNFESGVLRRKQEGKDTNST